MKDVFYINALDGTGSLVIEGYKYLTDLTAATKLAEFWTALTGQKCEVRRMCDDLSGMIDRSEIWPTK